MPPGLNGDVNIVVTVCVAVFHTLGRHNLSKGLTKLILAIAIAIKPTALNKIRVITA